MVEVATEESRMTVRVDAVLTDEFDDVTGLGKLDASSPMLFNLAPNTLYGKCIHLIAECVSMNRIR